MKKMISILSVALLTVAFASGCGSKHKKCEDASKDAKDAAVVKAECVKDKMDDAAGVCRIDSNDDKKCVTIDPAKSACALASAPKDQPECDTANVDNADVPKANVESCTFKAGKCEVKLKW